MSPEYNEPTPTTVIETVVEEAPTNFESPEVVEASPTPEIATNAAAMLAINQEVARVEVAQALETAAANDWGQDRIDSVTEQIKAKFQTH